jgi:beta-lactamase class A
MSHPRHDVANIDAPRAHQGLLPCGTPAAHKTGTLGGVANDAGFATLPDGGRTELAVFTTSSSTPVADRERAIAETARAAYDHFATGS